jgi:hypothetical protein
VVGAAERLPSGESGRFCKCASERRAVPGGGGSVRKQALGLVDLLAESIELGEAVELAVVAAVCSICVRKVPTVAAPTMRAAAMWAPRSSVGELGRGVHPASLVAAERALLVVAGDDVLPQLGTDLLDEVSAVTDTGSCGATRAGAARGRGLGGDPGCGGQRQHPTPFHPSESAPVRSLVQDRSCEDRDHYPLFVVVLAGLVIPDELLDEDRSSLETAQIGGGQLGLRSANLRNSAGPTLRRSCIDQRRRAPRRVSPPRASRNLNAATVADRLHHSTLRWRPMACSIAC